MTDIKNTYEPLLNNNGRQSVVPQDAKFSKLWECYTTQLSSFWTSSQIHFDKDAINYCKLPDDIRNMYDNVLGFFAIGDEIIMENLNDNFLGDIKNPEALTMLRWQTAIEDIHSQVYNRNIESIYPLTKDRDRVFNLTKTSTILERKVNFAKKYMDPNNATLGQRLIAFIAYEGVGFSGSFAAIDWGKTQNFQLEGMFHHNDYISNDEAMHTVGGVLMEGFIVNKATDTQVREILGELMEIEIDLWNTLIPQNGFGGGLTRNNMAQHIRHCCNVIAHMLGRPNIYKGDSVSPFKFLSMRSLKTKFNFFEKDGTNYQMSEGSSAKPMTENSFKLTDDF